MNKTNQILRTLTIIFGFLTVASFVYAFFVLIKLQPKMVAFDALSTLESSLMSGVGFALLIILIFYLLSLWIIVRFVKYAERLAFFPLFLIIGSVLSLLFVFSDIALLGDIHKQYQHGLSQPEWSMVFPFLGGQFLVALLLVYLHLSSFFTQKQIEQVRVDVNIFLVVQYVGVICGGMGLVMAFLGFFFPRGWSLVVHTIMASITLLFPYGLAVIYWGVMKKKEKQSERWDEKQLQDSGKAALLTLAVNTVLMIVLFIFNVRQLDGVVSMQWLPIYLFATVFVFSLGNIYFSSRA